MPELFILKGEKMKDSIKKLVVKFFTRFAEYILSERLQYQTAEILRLSSNMSTLVCKPDSAEAELIRRHWIARRNMRKSVEEMLFWGRVKQDE